MIHNPNVPSPVLPSFQDFAKHSGQGQIKGLSRLKELNLTTENLSPVRWLGVQPRNSAFRFLQRKKKTSPSRIANWFAICPQANLAEGSKHKDTSLRSHQNTWILFLAFCVVLDISPRHFSISPSAVTCCHHAGPNRVTFLLLQCMCRVPRHQAKKVTSSLGFLSATNLEGLLEMGLKRWLLCDMKRPNMATEKRKRSVGSSIRRIWYHLGV